jgi:acetate kinase
MKHTEPERITPKLLAELHRITPYDPDHLPREIGLIEAIWRRHPRLPQVACFDTAFHRSMPRVAKLLPIPRRYAAKGVERYGFHGLSYAYLMEELGRLDAAAALGGVDTLVFAAGIGENAPAIRQRICDGLGFLGIELNQERNAKNAPLISPDAGRVKVRVIHTDEELMIARSVSRVLNFGGIREN